jgi:hypothetical protein
MALLKFKISTMILACFMIASILMLICTILLIQQDRIMVNDVQVNGDGKTESRANFGRKFEVWHGTLLNSQGIEDWSEGSIPEDLYYESREPSIYDEMIYEDQYGRPSADGGFQDQEPIDPKPPIRGTGRPRIRLHCPSDRDRRPGRALAAAVLRGSCRRGRRPRR